MNKTGRKMPPPLLYAVCSMLMIAFLWSGQAYAYNGLKSGMPELCYQCHKKLKDDLNSAYVHFPFKQGLCSSCHNPHTSNIKGLLNGEINALCLGCHKDIRNLLSKASVHSALKDGRCTDCHYAHSGENKYLLVAEEKNLCRECHGRLEADAGKANVHKPFSDGKCSSCHNPHASGEENQLLAAPRKLCKSCHNQPLCKAEGAPISSATKSMDCTSCHAGHSSDAEGLLGPYGHTAFLDRKCGRCHNPVSINAPLTTKLPGEALCFSCHEKDPSKFREGDIHAKGVKNTCAMCHNNHASGRKNLTVEEADLCLSCHKSTAKRIARMENTLKGPGCDPVKNRKCFECHIPVHSGEPLYFRADKISTCSRCHESEHKITHPLGPGVIDPRNGGQVTCISCHSIHSARAEFMLSFDRKRQLCIQCHKK